MFAFIVQLIALLVLLALLFWVMGELGTPPQIRKVVLVLVVVMATLWVVYTLLRFAGVAPALG